MEATHAVRQPGRLPDFSGHIGVVVVFISGPFTMSRRLSGKFRALLPEGEPGALARQGCLAIFTCGFCSAHTSTGPSRA